MIQLTGLENVSDLLSRYEQDYLRFQGRELRVNLNRLDRVRRILGGRSVLKVDDFDGFFSTMRGLQPSTRNRYRALIGHVLKWGRQRGLVEGELPIDYLKMEQESNERTRRLSAEEEAALVAAMDEGLRELFVAALDTGLRRGALLGLRRRDVQAGVLVVPAHIQKHRRSQRIPLSRRLQAIVDKGADSARPTDFLFDGRDFRKRWESARKAAGVGDFRWHDIRGEFASRLDERGVEVSVTSQLLGHASLNTTQRYLRPRVERFREAIDKLGV